LFYQREFRELYHMAEVTHERYLDTACEVNRLGGCLDTVEVALEALGRETAAA
jgi:hypothetical protein